MLHSGGPDGSGNVGAKNDESGKILVFGAQPVSEPRAHRRTAGLVRARVHHQTRRLMIRNFGVDRADPAHIVGDLAKVRPQLADIHSALAVLLELERRLHQLAGPALGLDPAAGNRLPIVLLKRGFGIERIDGGAASVHE